MSYQVLARKWRPRSFAEMVGQEHVLRALINALDHDRLHHAFLFAGTRGVGKTTIARILAKSLNCEKGVSSTPCGECSACREIDEGRFVDLIEVDAASRTKVEDTRELLDNVQYAPTRGRYKVYLIDEVHMLSNHSFNALLKTLEEPPPHIKFLLATTDPQKLPVTILSRCLQFNLRRLPAELIREHLSRILEQEGVPAEPAALSQVARAADGSMRDALSLLDQAIAYGAGQITGEEVQAMLGTIEQGHVQAILQALARGDAGAVLDTLNELSAQAPDYAGVLAEIVLVLHRVALLQVAPDAYDEAMGDRDALSALAEALSPEDVQLFYQIGLIGRRDLPLAPDPRSGLEMVLLRMLAFRPAGEAGASAPLSSPQSTPAAGRVGAGAAAGGRAAPTRRTSSAAPARGGAKPAAASSSSAPASRPRDASNEARTAQGPAPAAPTATSRADTQTPSAGGGPVEDWAGVVAQLKLSGVVRQLAVHAAPLGRAGNVLEMALDPACAQLLTKEREAKLQEALSAHFGEAITLHIKVQAPPSETPAAREDRQRGERQAEAERQIQDDANVQAIVEKFDARIKPDSIQPLD
ncbi:MAG: DNA polymerase III subunit gamma/tau [Gammaproteobacteria bacterium]